MADYTLHLGFRWDGPAIGSILGTGAVLPYDARFLQFALASAGGAAAWFQLQPQDTLSVTIWDLSSSSAPGPSDFMLGLDMSFGPLDGTSPYTTIDPGTLVASDDYTVATQEHDGKSSQVLRSDAIDPIDPTGDCPWGAWRKCYAAGRMTFTDETSYELAFIVTVSHQGNKQYFVADPEVIIGPAGGGSGGGGAH